MSAERSAAEDRADYLAGYARAFAESPVAGIDQWITTGVAPSAKVLRAAGLQRLMLFGLTDSEADAAFARTSRLNDARAVFIKAYGFSVPCAEAVDALRSLGPLLEVGAGSGYWAALLTAAGVDIIATDQQADGRSGYGFECGKHHPVLKALAHHAVRAHPDRDVFCSWPSYEEPWALAAARAVAPGRHFAYIGEGRGGCTGTDGLHRYLDTRFEEVALVAIPQFPGLNDWLTIYRRKAQ